MAAYHAGYYYKSAYAHGVTCKNEGDPTCGECSGKFEVLVYAKYGNFGGSVTLLPQNQPAPAGTPVDAKYGVCGAYAFASTTDAAGTYNFARDRGAPWYGNDWGVFLTDLTSAEGPVTQDYTLTACNAPCAAGTYATTSSSQLTTVNLTCGDGMEEPLMRAEAPQAAAPVPGASRLRNPISVTTGNVFLDQTDAMVRGRSSATLGFTRSYNSMNTEQGRYGVFGPGWFHTYEKRLTQPDGEDPSVLLLRESNGVPNYFADPDGDQVYDTSVPFTDASSITRHPNGSFIREWKDGGSELYAALPSGRLTAMIDAAGNTTALGYDGQGRLVAVVDPGSRQLTLAYPSPTTITLSGPAGVIATFTLESGLLAAVEYTAGDTRPNGGYTFTYQDDPPRRLLTVTDASGHIAARHTYLPDGRGRTVELADGVEKFTLDYQHLKTVVTDAQNKATMYEYSTIWGQKFITKSAAPCARCRVGGGETQEWTYDSRGRLISHRDGGGNVTTY